MSPIRAQSGKALLWILLLAALAGGAIYYFYVLNNVPEVGEAPLPPPISKERERPGPATDEEDSVSSMPLESSRDSREAPVPETAEPLPALAESDAAVRETADELLGQETARKNLVTEGVISRFVATIDALTLDELPKNIMPVEDPVGDFEVVSEGPSQDINPETGLPETRYVLDSSNFQRYATQVEILEAVDTRSLVGQYHRYYPLLQQSYRELGYPEGEFNDRLGEVIQHLLDTPEPARPVRLVKPEASYVFEDPELEALSAGQKILIRMGPSNAERVKAKLSEIREALQTQRE
jgi:hypothetical protein